ncbi:conserved exported protein of unknown function [Rhodovastum atsumiense]|uniref:Cysteine rich repeat protein n=1 Tax=Rhodovastum atsumiense TaxID=504468 RepID=A0A5M6ISA8_9PROT|nr:cysteine rich repeat-containing protein [Rhodovastum atsumiense]KAA5611193.1 hypothetical protein F1189_15605 [Rhodovastum atsumiense]CAH2602499.1 conserved exported protein of unknown function [Rhodovastum atsumiense]
MIRLSAATALMVCLLGHAVWAQVPPPSPLQIAEACGDDIDRLCPGVPPGEGRIKACMKAHASQLSAPCFDTLMAAAAARKEAPQ